MACSGVGLHDLRQWDGWVRLHSRTQGRKKDGLLKLFWCTRSPKLHVQYRCKQIQANFTSDILVNSTVVVMSLVMVATVA